MRDATGVVVREALASDAPELLETLRQLDAKFDLLYEPGERPEDVHRLADTLTEFGRRTNSIYLLAFVDGRLAGYLWADGGRARRRSRSAYLAMAVDEASQGRGVGRALMEALTTWADRAGLLRLELVVLVDNAPARALYESVGFEYEGVLRNYLWIQGRARDVMSMARVRAPLA